MSDERSFLLRAFDELEASRNRHPARGKGLRPRTPRGNPPQPSYEDELTYDNVIPLFPRNKPNN